VELATPSVNANNSTITPALVRRAINKVPNALAVSQVGTLISYTALEQEHAWEQLGVTVNQVLKGGGGGRVQDLDLLFTRQKTMGASRLKPASMRTRHEWVFWISRTGAGRQPTSTIRNLACPPDTKRWQPGSSSRRSEKYGRGPQPRVPRPSV
jgi:hypothetical protein